MGGEDKKKVGAEIVPSAEAGQVEVAEETTEESIIVHERKGLTELFSPYSREALRTATDRIEVGGIVVPPGEIIHRDLITSETTPDQIRILRAVHFERLKMGQLYIVGPTEDRRLVLRKRDGEFVTIAQGSVEKDPNSYEQKTPDYSYTDDNFDDEFYVGNRAATAAEVDAEDLARFMKGLSGESDLASIQASPQWQLIAQEDPHAIELLEKATGKASEKEGTEVGGEVLESDIEFFKQGVKGAIEFAQMGAPMGHVNIEGFENLAGNPDLIKQILEEAVEKEDNVQLVEDTDENGNTIWMLEPA